MKKSKPLKEDFDQNLDAEEKDLLESFEHGEWKGVADLEKKAAFAREAAANYFRRDARKR